MNICKNCGEPKHNPFELCPGRKKVEAIKRSPIGQILLKHNIPVEFCNIKTVDGAKQCANDYISNVWAPVYDDDEALAEWLDRLYLDLDNYVIGNAPTIGGNGPTGFEPEISYSNKCPRCKGRVDNRNPENQGHCYHCADSLGLGY